MRISFFHLNFTCHSGDPFSKDGQQPREGGPAVELLSTELHCGVQSKSKVFFCSGLPGRAPSDVRAWFLLDVACGTG